jgi:hypothetical protein
LSGRPVTFAPTGRALVWASSIAMVIVPLPVPVNSGR